MKKLFAFRFAFIALLALFGASIATPSHAQGNIQFSIAKGGWIIGASAGQGTLTFDGRSYPVAIGGLSAGLVFGGSVTDFRGTVTGIRTASDIKAFIRRSERARQLLAACVRSHCGTQRRHAAPVRRCRSA